jgi:hypothetical protein
MYSVLQSGRVWLVLGLAGTHGTTPGFLRTHTCS